MKGNGSFNVRRERGRVGEAWRTTCTLFMK